MLSLISDCFLTKLIIFALALCQINLAELESEVILCRTCGEDIGYTKYAFNLPSPQSKSVIKQTDFESYELCYQVLENYFGVSFELMTISNSTCLEHGSWETKHSWFPGYAWKVCFCPRCHKHLGCCRHTHRQGENLGRCIMGASVELTEKQLAFLKECEEQFENRFTADDREYVHECNTVPTPPVFLPWVYKPRRRFFDSRDRRGGSPNRPRDHDEYPDRRREGGSGGWRENQRRDHSRRDDRRYRPYGRHRSDGNWNDGRNDRHDRHDRGRRYDNDRRDHRDPDGRGSRHDNSLGYSGERN